VRYAILVAAVALVIAGCSSQPPPDEPLPGTLVLGTAQVTVNDTNTGTTEAVQCTPAGTLTTITTGDEQSGVTAMVSSDQALTVESVSIRDVAGFTGSYNAGLGGEAEVSLTGRTYTITGTADGFQTANPGVRASGTFAITVAC
jgi:ipoprotein LpqH